MRITRPATRRGGGVIAIAIVAAALLAGCSSEATVQAQAEPTSAARSKYPEPIDLANARASCLEDRGWAVKVEEDAAITATLKPGTEADYHKDDTACLKKLGVDPDAPPTEAQYEQAYKDSVRGADCLRESGWSVSRSPTFETFKDTYDSNAWYTWAEVPDEDFEEAVRQCPTPDPTY